MEREGATTAEQVPKKKGVFQAHRGDKRIIITDRKGRTFIIITSEALNQTSGAQSDMLNRWRGSRARVDQKNLKKETEAREKLRHWQKISKSPGKSARRRERKIV